MGDQWLAPGHWLRAEVGSYARSLLIVALVSVLPIYANEEPGGSKAASKSDAKTKMPVLDLFDLDGKQFDFWNRDRPVVTVVLFVRTDCPIANRYVPEIRRLYDLYRARGVEFFLVYVDPRQRPEAIRRHLKDYQIPCKGLRDPKHALVRHCRATITPEAVVFDRDHAIRYLGRVDDLYMDFGRSRPVATTHDLADAIESTVRGRPVAKPRTPAIGCTIADLKE